MTPRFLRVDDARRLLGLVGILVFIAPNASGQLTQPGQDPEKANLARYHDELRNHADLHDTYIEVAPIGNEETVPLLLERLRKDFGGPEPSHLPGTELAFDCAQIHLIDALREITNTDQGLFYPRWAAWWAENHTISQRRWILDGFAAEGLHAVDPVNEQFGLELIEQMGRSHDYHSFNAARLLAEIPPERRMKWAALASVSSVVFARLGTIGVVVPLQVSGSEDLLRALTTDSDLEVRRRALSALNEHFRNTLAASPSHARLLRSPKPNNKTDGTTGISFLGDLLITASYKGEVQAFDIHTFQPVWTRHVFVDVGNQMAASRGQVILASGQGGLVSINQRGRILWQRKAVSKDHEVRRILFSGNEILVAHLNSVERVDPVTGRTKSRIHSFGTLRDIDATEGRAFFADEKGLHSLKVTSRLEYLIPHAIGVSVSPESVCVTSSAISGGIVTCLNPDTLTLQWTRPIASDGTWGHSVAPTMGDLHVLVPTDADLTAFRASDGSLLWTSQGGQEAQGTVALTGKGVLIQSSRYRLELRDLANGEVRSVWPQIDAVMRLAVAGQSAAVVDMDGGLWFINLND